MSQRTYGPYQFDASREDKVLFPDDGITKGDLIDYYERIADHMLPWLRDRPISMKRYPDGIDEQSFFQKKAPDYFPDWIERVTVQTQDGSQQQVVVQNKATLAYLADQACITPHVWLGRTDKLHHPDRMIFDLDPPGDDFGPVRNAAGILRDFFDEMGLPAFVKTTGSKGLHVVTPLDRSADFDVVRRFARDAAALLAARHDDSLTVETRKAKRGDRLFLDTARNAYAQTVVPPYAVRARPGGPVATPVRWDELSDADLHARSYTTGNIFRRLSQIDDPWKDLTRSATSLDTVRQRLTDMMNEENVEPQR